MNPQYANLPLQIPAEAKSAIKIPLFLDKRHQTAEPLKLYATRKGSFNL